MQWYPELRGKELGGFIKQFKADFNREQVLEMSPGAIEKEVRRRVGSST